MRTPHWDYTCDWCGTAETRRTETLPEDWRMVLIGADNRGPQKWESRRHICEKCYSGGALLCGPLAASIARERDAIQESTSQE